MAKPDTPPESKETKDPKDPAPAPVESKGGGGIKTWLPALAAVLLAPAASFAVAEFLLLPRLQAKLSAPPVVQDDGANERNQAKGKSAKEKGDHEKDGAAGENYEFNNVVVNLAGTMGTRYLKVSFIVTGIGGKGVKALFDGQKAKLTDITLNVLSSLTLADLEEPGSKNVLREKLVAAYNQALGKRLVEQVYFSDFVIQ
ncbi:MAG: flagellar basal body-associated FliL family protein [Candidatus Didemnitutus sp.]|nr:flagellar basal body-associated FliL family protein [Candidatus Didemnitutus sp.]